MADERQELFEAAIELFDLKGYQETTVQEIVERVGRTKYSFYRYFKSKEEVLYLIHEYLINDMLNVAESVVRLNRPVGEKLGLLVSNVMHNMQHRKSYVRVFFSELSMLEGENIAKIKAKRDRLFHLTELMIWEGMRTGELRPDQDPTILTLGLFGMCNWMYQWFRPDGRMTADEVGHIFLRLFLEGTNSRLSAGGPASQVAASTLSQPSPAKQALSGKVVLITGAGRGAGHVLAMESAQNGAIVALLDNRMEDIRSVADLLTGQGFVAGAWQADLTDGGQVEAVVRQIYERHGRIDALVKYGERQESVPFLDMPREAWDRMQAVNLDGLYTCTRAVLPVMIRQGKGSIVTVASLAGIAGSQAGAAHQAASRGAAVAFTKAVAQEFGLNGIRANVVAHGLIGSGSGQPFSDREAAAYAGRAALGRTGTPEDLANAVLFLAGDGSGFITGQVINVCGGVSINQ